MAQTIQLTQNELQKLIIETYKQLTDKNFVLNSVKNTKYNNWKNLGEQAEVIDGMAYLDPNQSMANNMSDVKKLQDEIDGRVTYARKKHSKGVNAVESGSDAWYTDKHIWADILAAVLYIAGAITSVAGVGVILLGVAIIVDLVNAYWYYDEEDYFMAGLQASFILIPVINLGWVKLLPGFKTGMTKLGTIANKSFKSGSVPTIKEITTKLGKETTEAIGKTLRKNPIVLKTAKSAIKKIDGFIKAFKQLKKWVVKTNKDWLYDYLIPDFIIDALRGMIWVMKKLKSALVLVVAIFAEMSLYDPEFISAPIMDLLGFDDTADWFRSQPKYGLNLWNGLLKSVGNYKGVMTTTPYDCRGSVYKWDDIVTAFEREEKYSNRESVSERRIWEKWTEDNWRPQAIPGSEDATGVGTWYGMQATIKQFPELKKDVTWDEEIMTNCYNFVNSFYSQDKDIMNKTAAIVEMVGKKME